MRTLDFGKAVPGAPSICHYVIGVLGDFVEDDVKLVGHQANRIDLYYIANASSRA